MSSSPIKITLVDDDEDVFFLTQDLLSDVTDKIYDVQWVSSFDAALAKISEESSDVCIVDYYLGVRTGLELIQELVDQGVQIPIILMTGQGDRTIDLKAMEAGASDYISKDNVSGEILERAIRYSLQREKEVKARKQLEARLQQAQKLEAIGQLAAGIAHEINSPMQYISNNINYLQKKIPPLLETFKMLPEEHLMETFESLEGVRKLETFIMEALIDSADGVRRVNEIVKSVQAFSHSPSKAEPVDCDVSEIIEGVIRLAKNKWKYSSTIETQYQSDLPQVRILRGVLEQALLNLIVNAVDAIETRIESSPSPKGAIYIHTEVTSTNQLQIRVSDNGCGIDDETMGKIFHPFFTTKDVGKGTGQGLAILQKSIVGDLGGSVHVESQVNRGTTFILRLPIAKEHENG